jgi:uncharacterized repeat protein (TIGR03803 family)
MPMDSVTATNSDGAIPFGGLVLSNVTLYGTTTAGGEGGHGTIFSIQTNGLVFTVLHHFSAIDPGTGTNADGAAPCAALAVSGNVLYGTASAGSTGASGAIYSLKTDGTQFKTLYSFTPLNPSNGTNSDGAFPVAGLLLVGNSLYGTTFSGGPGSVGTVFRLPIPPAPATITNTVLKLDRTVTLFFIGSDSTNIVRRDQPASPTMWQNMSTNVADPAGAWHHRQIATNPPLFRSMHPTLSLSFWSPLPLLALLNHLRRRSLLRPGLRTAIDRARISAAGSAGQQHTAPIFHVTLGGKRRVRLNSTEQTQLR